jgi:hypothetical protein
MKYILKNTLQLLVCLGIIAFSLSGCYESHYYHQNHYHTRGWYDNHHTPPPAGVNFDVDVHH